MSPLRYFQLSSQLSYPRTTRSSSSSPFNCILLIVFPSHPIALTIFTYLNYFRDHGITMAVSCISDKRLLPNLNRRGSVKEESGVHILWNFVSSVFTTSLRGGGSFNLVYCLRSIFSSSFTVSRIKCGIKRRHNDCIQA